MVSDTATSSHASVMSVDPAVASRITGTTVTGATSRSRTGSSPYKSMASPGSVGRSHGHARNKSAPLQNDKHSLRRAKNSTEVLRQRSTRSNKKTKVEEPAPDSRGGRNFTIGNVGTGGLMYLKPSPHQHATAQTSPPPLMPHTAPADFGPLLTDDKTPTQSKHPTRSATTSPAFKGATPISRPAIEAIRSRHGRSQSVSTVDDHQNAMVGRSKTLKVVINRPQTAEEAQEEDPERPELPTLAVPIPHYRLGQPRFSTNGTPDLRSSSFLRTSNTPSEASCATPRQLSGAGPPGSSTKPLARVDNTGRGLHSSGSDTAQAPIQPEIYNALAEIYDDPAVVRYSHNVRDVTAATPARLIAQISSESFMDYELVSDFFLTFRSYMSTSMVLDLLLARLSWAINRQEDDGRIIRVRTFAALRHWILNYFVDDFIPSRKLRVRFCTVINRMYLEVARRRSSGTSDLKVLRDLKRCWNGRCSMYWDSDDFNVDGDQDEDLLPGDDDEPELDPNSRIDDTPPLPRNVRTVSNTSWFNIPPNVASKAQQHTRQDSGKQESVLSDQSLQAKSCNVPKGLFKPEDAPLSGRTPHPVPVQLRRPNANGTLEVKTGHLGHRKGAASVDSDREPTPRGEQPLSGKAFDGSIIRGSVYAPSAPFVQIVPSPSAPSVGTYDNRHNHQIKFDRGQSPNSAHGPAVKNIFGSLRKALAGKHGNSNVSLVTVSAPIPIHEDPAPPRAQLPLNMSKSHDELRSKAHNMPKSQLRMDLLCAQVAQNYELLFPHAKYARHVAAFPEEAVRPAPEHEARISHANTLLTPDLRQDRLPSHTTARSGSIVIVNDTGMGASAMSGALPSQAQLRAAYEAQTSPKRTRERDAAVGLGIDQERPALANISPQRSSDALGSIIEARPNASPKKAHLVNNDQEDAEADIAIVSSSPLPQPSSPTASPSSVRRKRSDQSTQAERTAPTATPASSTAPAPAGPAHGLRRRPGGDLRNVENVHEMPQHQHHGSTDTTTTASVADSVLVMQQRPKAPIKQAVSMINTHSSQHLRPSFEKAIAGFSDIPDDGDGGLEATLLKLEGRYEKQSPPLQQHPLDTLERRRSMPEMSTRNTFGSPTTAQASAASRGNMYRAAMMSHGSFEGFDLSAGPVDTTGSHHAHFNSVRESRKSSIFGMPGPSDYEDDSENPLPLLKRDTNSATVSMLPSPPTRFPEPPQVERHKTQYPPHLQQDFAGTSYYADNQENIRPATANESAQSFLLDEDENLSDLSSEISVDVINYAPNVRTNSPMFAAPGTAVSGLEIPSHPLTYASVINLAPPELQRESTIRGSHAISPYVHLPLPKMMSSPSVPQVGDRSSGGPAHIPFILAADSQVIAQQLTLIEKSALTEIEWSDLVDMKWENTSPRVLDWAEYLTKADINGVDLVITRFNLVSRWVRSQIVLTHDIEERALVITKFIHVAAHARRLHNYATMVQITIGLTSTDATRLAKTWERVPAPDKSLLKNMERLVQPIRNFHELRIEIESADFSDGCIPFIGLYVHDLTYNAQKPAVISSRQGRNEPLINFERYRTTAVIVKSLLRLIDASTRYQFEPIKGLVERCLWLAALSDEKIYSLSRALEAA